jgi:phage tail sheath gpL-like
MIKAVKQYAMEHYEEEGWDYIVECYSDEDILDIIKDSATEADAIEAVRQDIAPRAQLRDEVRAEIF